MKILFIAGTYKPAFIYGGFTVATAMLAENLVKAGHEVTVFTTTANGENELDVVPNEEVIVDGVKIIYFRRVTKDHTHVSFALWKHLNQHVKEYDIVHIHSWWNFLAVGAAYICRNKQVTPILSPHGMLSSYVLQTNNSLIKKLLHKAIGKSLLASTVLHVSTKMEWKESLQLIPDWKGIIIRNLVNFPKAEFRRITNNVFTIGFLSRIDPKKGLDLLLEALSKIDFDYQLFIAGSGDADYISFLQKLCIKLKIEQKVHWIGWKEGEEKFEFLAGLDLFALTSHSENFGVVVIESLLVGTPVLVSNQVGLFSYLEEKDLGWVTDNKPEKIAHELNILHSQKYKLFQINLSSPDIVRKDFKPDNLVQLYVNFYNEHQQGMYT